MNELKVLELFSGIGALTKALERLNIEHEIVDAVEIDKYAVASYNAIHNTNFEPQDICTWDKDIEVDLIMHGSPCQDFSLAGKQAGGDKDSGTRSSLMYETIRIVGKLKPKYVIWENVKNLLSKKHIHNFNAYLETMEQLGYKNYYQVLNAKDYGIPQNRERVFTVSILNGNKYEFPKGEECNNSIKVVGNYMPSGHDASRIVDENGIAPTVKENHGTVTAVLQRFEFPPKQELKLKLKDMLEDEVDDKYYLSDKMVNFFYKNEQVQKEKGNGFRFNVTDGNVVAKTITTRAGSRMDDNFIGDKEEYKNAYLRNFGSKGKLQDKDYCDTLTASMGTGGGNVPIYQNELRIRKLTPKECWRLMGFDDEDFEKAEKVNSNSQLYKQAGNSICVPVLEAILRELLKIE